MSVKSLQGWCLHHYPGQPIPGLDNPFHGEIFPSIQFKLPVVPPTITTPGPSTAHSGVRTSSKSNRIEQGELPGFSSTLYYCFMCSYLRLAGHVCVIYNYNFGLGKISLSLHWAILMLRHRLLIINMSNMIFVIVLRQKYPAFEKHYLLKQIPFN